MLLLRAQKCLMEALSAGVITSAIVAADHAQQHGLQVFIIADNKCELYARLEQQLQKCWRDSTGLHYLEACRATQRERGVTRTPRSRVGVQPKGQAC